MSLSAFYYCLVLVFVYVTVLTHHATSRPFRLSQLHPNTTLQVKVFAWSPFGNQLFWFTEVPW